MGSYRVVSVGPEEWRGALEQGDAVDEAGSTAEIRSLSPVADALMKVALILAGTIAVVLVLAVLPNILARLLDPRNMKLIRAHCEAVGLSDIEVKAWPNHYGVSFHKDGNKHYAKCRVVKGVYQMEGQGSGAVLEAAAQSARLTRICRGRAISAALDQGPAAARRRARR